MSSPATAGSHAPRTAHRRLIAWVDEVAALTKPDRIHWCDGSAEEYDQLAEALVAKGTFQRLSDAKRPNSYLALSDPDDVARVEDRTFICSEARGGRRADEQLARAGGDAQGARRSCLTGSMLRPDDVRGAVLDGPARVADLLHRRAADRLGLRRVLDADHDPDGPAGARRARRGRRVRAVPALGRLPALSGRGTVPWPCNAENKYIVHFPETREIWSYGSGYGGNALLGKKCFALRIASVMARDEGWLAEHMLILKLTSPEGEVKYIAAAFPSACGKTNLAMLIPTLAGLEGRDDRRRHRVDEVRLRRPAVRGQPRGRVLRRRPRHRRDHESERDRDDPPRLDLHQLRLTDDGDVWWEGLTAEPPAHAIDWRGNDWTPDSETPAAHPNARFTAPAAQCPSIAPEWEDPAGVPIDAILFGGRRSTVVPLVCEARDWEHGVFLGSTMSSETTAAAAGEVGSAAVGSDGDAAVLRLPHGRLLPPLARRSAARDGAQAAADLLRQLVPQGTRTASSSGPATARTPACWPGSSAAARATPNAVETAIGLLPPARRGRDQHRWPRHQRARRWPSCSTVDIEGWKEQLPQMHEHYAEFGDKLPAELHAQLDTLETQCTPAVTPSTGPNRP